MNFSRNEEEEDNIDVEDDKTGEEKGKETSGLSLDPTKLVVNFPIVPSTNNTNKTGHGNTPSECVVELFVSLDLLVSFDDHLVEVESDNSTPAKIGNEKVVCDSSTTLTEGAFNDSVSKRKHEEEEGKDNGDALVHNQPNGIGSQLGKDEKGHQGQNTTNNRDGQEDISQDVDNIIHTVRGFGHD